MYFCGFLRIKYTMRKLIRFICAGLCVCAVVGGAVCAFINKASEAESGGVELITVWQIDNFEGGKGSRAEYLRSIGNKFYSETDIYVDVTAVSADAARANISAGTLPDIISYGSGFYGLESIVDEKDYSVSWCRGAYCLISINSSDFSAANKENTVVNAGRDNLTEVVALLSGLEGATEEAPTAAYVSLINGEYEYLLGTQRDIIRLQTRKQSFNVFPLTCFNDLYQNFFVIAKGEKQSACRDYIDYVISESENLYKTGMFYGELHLYSDEMNALEKVSAEFTVPPIVSEEYISRLKSAASATDINMLKSLLKPLK